MLPLSTRSVFRGMSAPSQSQLARSTSEKLRRGAEPVCNDGLDLPSD